MQNATSAGARRQKWLNAYRIATPILLVGVIAVVAIYGNLLLSRSFAPITATQADKIEQASSFLEDAGFGDPVYLGILPAVEGEYPTFRATAIGGASVDLLIRTTNNGGWEIQPAGVFESIASADDLARLASSAVRDWEHIPADITPRTDGSYGEYESREYSYNLLKDYNPDDSYWDITRDETGGWPRK